MIGVSIWSKVLFLSVVVSISLILTQSVHAKKTLSDAPGFLDTAAEPTGIEKTEVTSVAGKVVRAGLTGIGLIFFVLMVYAGLRWMTARGDETKAEKARDTIIGATIGLAVVVGAYAVTTFVSNRIIKGQTSEFTPGEAIESTGEGKKVCCIVPTTAGSNVYTASWRTENECAAISEGGAKGVKWNTYSVANFSKCKEIFGCWDNNGGVGSNFDICMSKIGQ